MDDRLESALAAWVTAFRTVMWQRVRVLPVTPQQEDALYRASFALEDAYADWQKRKQEDAISCGCLRRGGNDDAE